MSTSNITDIKSAAALSNKVEKRYITKREAAKLIGVCEQTISNYIAQGLLDARKESRRVLVSGDAVERFLKEFRTLGASESLIIAKQKEIEALRFQLDIKEQALRDVLHARPVMGINRQGGSKYMAAVGKLVSILLDATSINITPREKIVVKSFFEGKSLREIAKERNVTPYLACTQFYDGLQKFINSAPQITQVIKDAKDKTIENKALCTALKEQEEKISWCVQGSGRTAPAEEVRQAFEQMPKLLKTRLWSTGEFSLRTVNCLYSGIEVKTVYDLLCQKSIKDLRKLRGFGKKCQMEIEDFMDKNHLCFKEPYENEYAFIKRTTYNHLNGTTCNAAVFAKLVPSFSVCD